MRAKVLSIPTLLIAMFFMSWQDADAHCEIPCGIYGDSLRIQQIDEHITTLEKSMNQIIELSEEGDKNYNQLVRWVTNKEEHAVKIQDIVSQYFLHQRIKPVDPSDSEEYEKYVKRLTLLHKLQVYAMKAKQTTDLDYIERLRDTLHEFADAYFHKH
ncbi:superoxide dismutase [Ni] [Marinilabilia sp.]|jgi:nickel superoxide dismutase